MKNFGRNFGQEYRFAIERAAMRAVYSNYTYKQVVAHCKQIFRPFDKELNQPDTDKFIRLNTTVDSFITAVFHKAYEIHGQRQMSPSTL